LANRYYEILKIELEHPEFIDPENTNKYKEVWPSGSSNYFKYDVYAGMYWAYALDIYDISKYYYSKIFRFETYFINLYTPTFEKITKLHIAWWEDKKSTLGTPGFREFIEKRKIQIQPITQSYYTNVLDLSSRLLGKGYLPAIPQSDKNKSVFLVAISSKKFIGFAYARITEKDELKVILKNRKIYIPPDIKRADEAGTLGFLKTVCVEPDFQGRGVATTLIKECLNNLVTLGAETLICIAWKSSAGVPIGGVLSKLGFREWITLDKFWAEESKSLNYSCPVCGDPPCNCSAVLYKCTDFSKELKKPFK
jgi:ribosomal protein S18 acetylase RimI-like enzyme